MSATATTSDRLPVVSIVIPALDAATTIGSCLNAVLRQDYDGEFDVVVAVGPSSDRTREIVERLAASDPRVRVIDNPSGRTPTGLNLAVAASSGSVIARIDAQSVVPVGYVRRAVESMLRTGAANVGGIQHPIGESGLQRVIAVAMASKFGAGPARFRRDGYEGPTDTVYLGVFDRDAIRKCVGVVGRGGHPMRVRDGTSSYEIVLEQHAIYCDSRVCGSLGDCIELQRVGDDERVTSSESKFICRCPCEHHIPIDNEGVNFYPHLGSANIKPIHPPCRKSEVVRT